MLAYGGDTAEPWEDFEAMENLRLRNDTGPEDGGDLVGLQSDGALLEVADDDTGDLQTAAEAAAHCAPLVLKLLQGFFSVVFFLYLYLPLQL